MRVHFIKRKQTHVAYFPDTYRFFSINDTAESLIQSICDEKEFEEVEDIHISKGEYLNFKEQIEGYSKKNPSKLDSKLENQSPIISEKVLSRLAINITNSCNLECKYCYANGGNYHSDEHIMKEETLKTTLDKFFSYYDYIQNIQLFGGEPLMSIRNMEIVCDYVKKINNTQDRKTSIGLVTNGTLINKKFIDLVKKHDLFVTVSFDGHRLVNDINRIYSNGRGTSQVIIDKVSYLKNETNQPGTIEVTYNKSHTDNNVTVKECVDTCNKLFGDIPIHLVPAGGTPEDNFVLDSNTHLIDSVDDIFDEWDDGMTSYSLINRIVQALVSKQGNDGYICDAGIGTLSVGADGGIYPCFMFTDNKDHLLGDINDEALLSSKKAYNILTNLEKFNNKKKNPKCQSCFMNTMCNGCLGLNELNSGQIDKLSETDCDMHKKMAEHIIVRLTENMEKANV
ncbi:radical SAM/SPASM domain-containing protein [Candidatus Enterococcus clewellii]|uniref:Radical SAM core domain-containing protein n=1 Tax=Candidatus Enterococcus clewellii TaxID=1834193 RepID=A0AAQ3VW34_9ENTE